MRSSFVKFLMKRKRLSQQHPRDDDAVAADDDDAADDNDDDDDDQRRPTTTTTHTHTNRCSIDPTHGRQWPPPDSGWANDAECGLPGQVSVLVDGAKRDRVIWPGDMGAS